MNLSKTQFLMLSPGHHLRPRLAAGVDRDHRDLHADLHPAARQLRRRSAVLRPAGRAEPADRLPVSPPVAMAAFYLKGVSAAARDAEPDLRGHAAVHGHPGHRDRPAVHLPGDRPVAAAAAVQVRAPAWSSKVGPIRDGRSTMTLAADAAVESIWRAAGLDPAALRRLQLPGSEPGLRSSFAVSTAAQTSLGAAALAAIEIGRAAQRPGTDGDRRPGRRGGRVHRAIHARRRRSRALGQDRRPLSLRAGRPKRVGPRAYQLRAPPGRPAAPARLARRTRHLAGAGDRRDPRLAIRRARGRSGGARPRRRPAAQLRGMGPASAGDRRRPAAADRDRAHRRRAATRTGRCSPPRRVRSRACASST